ncbi:MAG: putative protein kinase UbiB [Planctomycetes bacterium ADurb.Bin126]|nr:MAG: putative protein kinase UbiB [Planctomycetes bacterium ADurb.Bin126]HOD81807.1 AarF/ABC1/UbiB kinase family protein [Phycisphaerae bacterium]HQL75798.1 AarF/ABC1/UbiB kinase family protein [Phycisphaerae bacterium]
MARFRFHFGRTVQHFRRYRHILAVLMKYGLIEMGEGLARKLKSALGRRAVPERVRKRTLSGGRPQRLRAALQELGPTFIKLGQLLSTRPDVLPAEYILELEHLQDNVPPEPFERVRVEAERELGGRLEDLFASFDTTPLASASIAQVYAAVTREGERVVVKIRRPDIVRTIRTECEILEDLSGALKSMLGSDINIDPHRIIREFTNAVVKEVDFSNELENLVRFGRYFRQDPAVHVPRPFETFCTRGVLTMERIDGIKPNNVKAIDAAGLDRKEIARRGANFVLRQIFDFGFFHTDPHPGNLLICPGNVVVPLDFGQAARLSRSERQMLGELMIAVVDDDARRAVRAFQRMDMVTEETHLGRLVSDAEELIETYHDLPLGEIPFTRLSTQIFDLIRRHHVRPPPEFTLMLKSMMTIESVAVTLDPDFQIIEYLRPFARRIQLEQISPRRTLRQAMRAVRDAADLAGNLPEDISAILEKFKRGQFQLHVQHEHLENLTRTIDVSASQISFALIIAGLLIGSSLLVTRTGMLLGLVYIQTLGVLGYVAAAVLGAWLLVSMLRGRRF